MEEGKGQVLRDASALRIEDPVCVYSKPDNSDFITLCATDENHYYLGN